MIPLCSPTGRAHWSCREKRARSTEWDEPNFKPAPLRNQYGSCRTTLRFLAGVLLFALAEPGVRYSIRSAVIGSTLVARRAGQYHANNVAHKTSRATT